MSSSARLIQGFIHALALVLGTAAMVLVPVDQALANGPHMRSQEVFSGPAGTYRVRVLTAPVVGTMHLSIYVAQGGSNVPAGDVMLQVSGAGPQGTTAVGPARATAAFGDPGWYGVSLPIDEGGAWMFTLLVRGPLGEAQVEFPVNVQQAGGINGVVIGALAVLLMIAAWFVLSWIRGRGRPGGAP